MAEATLAKPKYDSHANEWESKLKTQNEKQ
jgi:hypothetical protein